MIGRIRIQGGYFPQSHPVKAPLVLTVDGSIAACARGETPLVLAVRAYVPSYSTRPRAPDSVEALPRAGASREGVEIPSGYEEIDVLLA